MIEGLTQNLSHELDRLFQSLLPKEIKKGLEVELGVFLRENGLKLHELATFLMMTDQWYGHLHPGGLESYEQGPDSKLQIIRMAQAPWGLIFSKKISQSSDARRLLILWILLKYLSQLQGFHALGLEGSRESLLELENPLLLKKNRKRIAQALANDGLFRSWSEENIKALSDFLGRLYHREYKSLSIAIDFSKKQVINLRLNILEANDKRPDIKNNRVPAEKIISARLIQGGDEYSTQLIEYSKNGNGISLFISVASQLEENTLKKNTHNIVVRIGQKKLSGLLMHITQKQEGLLLGIQLRYPVQNWEMIFQEALTQS